jgi:hypothetical protein
MIEIRENVNTEHEEAYQFFIDGLLLDEVHISAYGVKGDEQYNITTYDQTSSDRISACSISDFPSLSGLTFKYKIDWLEMPIQVSISYDSEKQLFKGTIAFLQLSKWRKPYSFRDYFLELRRLYRESGEQTINLLTMDDSEYENLPLEGFFITFPCSKDLPIISQVNRNLDVLRRFHEEAVKAFTPLLDDNSIMMSFDFPQEVKVPCEQYLLYFAQFLNDLGVEADTALTHEAGQVLFTVTPNDKQQALDKIRAALEVYLHLPSSPVSDTQQGEIAILRLNSELQNFQSKLSLARAEIQMKEATIQLQQVTIAQLTGEVVFESLKDVTPKPKDKDKEELLGDIVSLVPIKGKGFEVNLPEIFRKLKQLFKDKE